MLLELTARKTAIQSLALILSFLLTQQAMAEKAGQADALIEATFYEARARELMRCSLGEAEPWAKRAIETGRRFRSHSQLERDTAGAFLARVEMLSIQLKSSRRNLDQLTRTVGRLLGDNRPQSANHLLAIHRGFSCQPEFMQMRAQVDGRLADVDGLMTEAETVVRYDPSRAIKLYGKARKLDIEQPDLAMKVAEAKEIKRQMPRSHVAGGIVSAILVAAAVGGAAYAGKRYQQQRRVVR